MKNPNVYIIILAVILVAGIIVSVILSRTQTPKTAQPESAKQEQPVIQPEPKTEVTPAPVKEETTTNDLKMEILKEGSGTVVTKSGDMISVNYTGTLTNGTKFDSSLDRGTPFKFDLGAGQVIKGWDQGLIGMKVGETRKLTIPPSLGYGAQAMGDKIPANSTLIFEVTLVEILPNK